MKFFKIEKEIHKKGVFFLFQPDSKETVSVKKRKFSSFFKNIVIELDRELYGPDNHLVEVMVIIFNS